METAFSFMSNHQKTFSFFAFGDTFNQTESMTFLAVSKCQHVGTFGVGITLLAKFEFPTLTPNKSRLKV